VADEDTLFHSQWGGIFSKGLTFSVDISPAAQEIVGVSLWPFLLFLLPYKQNGGQILAGKWTQFFKCRKKQA